MTKQELIKLTLTAMGNAPTLNALEETGHEDDHDPAALAVLLERLPESEIKICQDLLIDVECCDTCHTFCPHYEMYLEQLPTGEIAWICCRVRSALRNPGMSEKAKLAEWSDLEEALGGGLRHNGEAMSAGGREQKRVAVSWGWAFRMSLIRTG